MADTKNAVAKKDSFYSIETVDGKQTFTLSKTFKTNVLRDAATVGEAYGHYAAAAAGKAELAVNITVAFDVAKKGNFVKGLPDFVNKYIDPTCPKEYGPVGSPTRVDITRHKIFTGIEQMVKNARVALKKQAERQALIAAGKDPGNDVEVRDFNKDKRDAVQAAFTKSFVKSMVDFVNFGVTDTTISNLLISVLKKKEKENNELNAQGKKLFEAASKAVLIAKVGKTEKAAEKVQAATQDVAQFATSMDQVKKAAKKK